MGGPGELFGFGSRQDYQRARELLQGAGYQYDAISESLRSEDWLIPRAIDQPTFLRRIKGSKPHHTLIRLFLLRCDVPVEDVRQSLRPMSLGQWIEAGLLRYCDSGDRIRATLQLTPLQDLILAADSPHLDVLETPSDFVMPVGGTSLHLGWSAISHPSRRTLDLGTGCGYLGLLAAPFSQQVVATDRNERAVHIASFNAALNGIEQMETRSGNLLEPVAGERFDLILSNPPFVITPARRYLYRDGGMRGDEFCRTLIRQLPPFLEEGGYCQMLANFAHHTNRPWWEDLSKWFTDLDCDATVFTLDRQPIDEYAMTWITTTESQDASVVPEIFERWMKYYEQEQIEDVRYLQIILRKRSDVANWIHIDKERVLIVGPCGDAIARRVASMDFLASLPNDEAILEQRFVLDRDSRLVQEHFMSEDGPRVTANRLEMRGGLRHSANLDANVLRLLVDCDGQQTLGQLLQKIADSLGIDRHRVVEIALPAVRQLVERGFLVPLSTSHKL